MQNGTLGVWLIVAGASTMGTDKVVDTSGGHFRTLGGGFTGCVGRPSGPATGYSS